MAVVPPTTSDVLPTLLNTTLAPTTLIEAVAGVAAHEAHEAVTVATRLIWFEDCAVMVNVAPRAVVVTDGALKITPLALSAARSMVAPGTDALPLVSAYNVNVKKDVPSAFNTLELELRAIEATLEFAVTGKLVVVVLLSVVLLEPPKGVPALPPPPPQAASTNVNPNPATYFKKLIRTFL
jgi:hypothetical protein